MPIYEYKCAECGFQEEFLQKHSDPQLTVCPSCGKETFKKLLSAAGFQLKGSGWYATDFKGGGAKPAAKSGDDAKGESGAAAEKSGGDTGGDKNSGDKNSGDKGSGDKAAEKSSDKGTAAAKSVPASTSG
jgi:putative FmdB family regulatory protein